MIAPAWAPGNGSFAAMLGFWNRPQRPLSVACKILCWRRQWSRAAVAALLCAGCSSYVDPISVERDCPAQPFRGPALYAGEPPDRLLSDFEDGTAELVDVADRNGSWIHGRDLTSVSVTIGPSSECAARGVWAGHLAASKPSSWGNNWTAFFRRPGKSAPNPYDGRQYGGVSFWAAFGGKNGPSFGVPVGIVTMDTVQPSCTSHCDDHYMTALSLTRDWRRYEVRFDDLEQNEPQSPMRRDQLVGFIIWTQQQCDIWIDDVRLEP